MAIQPNEQYVLKGKQIQDLASRLTLTGEEVADKAEKAQTGSTAPTTSTPGEIGQLYIQSDGTVYILKSIVEESGQPDEYTWEEVGGSSVNVVQSPGTSRTDVMSQYAATKLVYPDYSSTVLKAIRIIGSTSSGAHSEEVTIGYNVSANAGRSAVGVGYQSNNNGERSVAIGNYARATGEGAIAIGEGSYASTRGEMNIGTTTSSMYSRSYGYNNSPYRLLTGLYDPQSDHDAATKGYVDNSLLGKQDALTAGSGISIADESGSLVISTTVAEPDEFTSNEWNALWS